MCFIVGIKLCIRIVTILPSIQNEYGFHEVDMNDYVNR